ncbi:Oxidoreductase 2OG-Fe(II) oxygenase family [Penicillium nucicola]|uniref:Oxidoreductase 2OG-Fe(II) oxygenase family n=1 Tax=Penicillium nucicola TaxID=1850975 RepID=UPI0025456065|nr:Oxidoreductase 2OG-Fe(II) oxygenase family [Penicillium nucicola]KAJ5775000.1 Oxidoreductase 2OG-Fe(II) oxygenase family [Penicillium nucicola]
MANPANSIELPLVDISNSHDVIAGKKLLDAAVKFGFLYVDSNSTRFTASDVDQAFNLNRGWVGMHVETLDPEHHDIDEDFFTTRHDQSKGSTENSLRWLYYPAVVSSYRPGKDIRAGAHSDYGSITLLFQRPGQPGLEILTADNQWAAVPVYPGGQANFPFPPILVNIGDLLSYWTDGLLKSTVHRVVFPENAQSDHISKPQDRYSIAFFCQPVSETELVPVPSEIVSCHRKDTKGDEETERVIGHGGGARGWDDGQRRITAGQHLQSRLAATYI